MDIELPWTVRSRQEDGRRTEAKIASQEGHRLTPNSGAGRIKGDARTAGDGNYLEIKDANKSYTMNAEELLTSWIRASREGVGCEWLIVFKNGVKCRIQVEREM